MTQPTQGFPLNMLEALQRVHQAQLAAQRMSGETAERLNRATRSMISVLVIYIGLGPIPRIRSDHAEAVKHFNQVLDDMHETC